MSRFIIPGLIIGSKVSIAKFGAVIGSGEPSKTVSADWLRDDEYLKLVRIIDGGMALGWPDGQEVYPEALFAMSERVR